MSSLVPAIITGAIIGAIIVAGLLVASGAMGRMRALLATKLGRAPFEARPVMNRSEHELYLRLLKAAPPGLLVLPQVQMSAFLQVRGLQDRQERWRYLDRIIRLSLDFLVVDARTMLPLAGVELDGRTHRGAQAFASGQMDADARKTQAMAAAGVQLLRIQARAPTTDARLREWLAGIAARPSGHQ